MGRPFVDQATTERTKRFYAWERRGRGWDVFESTVELEPTFRWPQIHERAGTAVDDTRRKHWLARLFSQAKATEETDTDEEVPEAHVYERSEPPREFVIALPPSLSVPPEHPAALLFQGLQGGRHAPDGIRVDEGPHEDPLFQGVADLDLLVGLHQRGGQGPVDLFLDDDPARGGAALTGGADRAENNGPDRKVQIGLGGHNDGVVAPQFQ